MLQDFHTALPLLVSPASLMSQVVSNYVLVQKTAKSNIKKMRGKESDMV
jgi:hypothetical protein